MKNQAEFDRQYKQLNLAQKKAVDAIEGPVMVIAGPGTGKTTILSLRIANILRQTDTPPSGILAITFTDAGVKAMRMKLRQIIGNRADEIAIYTFHSFAKMVISDFSDHFPHLDGVKQMTDIDVESLIRVLLNHKKYSSLRPAGNPDFYISSIIKYISNAKKEAVTPEMLRGRAKEKIKIIKNSDDSYSTRGQSKGKLKAEAEKEITKAQKTLILADLYSQYQEFKKKPNPQKANKFTIWKNGLMDYDDLIIELIFALRNDQLLLRLLQERYLYIHIDEHQDTNDSQNLLIRMLAEFYDSPNVFIVGDEKQAIYRFQGASVENFLRFQNAWPNMEIIALTDNFRSHQNILNAGFSMIENNYQADEHQKLRVKLKSAKTGNRDKTQPIEIISGQTTGQLEEYLAQNILKITNEQPQTSVAILTKTNRELEQIVRVLESKRIPVSSSRNIDIFNHPAGVLFFDLIGFILDPSRTELLAKTLAVGLWKMPFEKVVTILKTIKNGTFGQFANSAWNEIQKSLINDGPIQALVNISEQAGYLEKIFQDPASVEVWRGIVVLSESLVNESNIQNPLELLQRLCDYQQSAEARSIDVPIGTPDLNVKVMTAHGSKGLEFDYVYIPYASEESWLGHKRGEYFLDIFSKNSPNSHLNNDGNYVKDARRLFYVAITRARKHVVILSAKEEDDGRVLTPLRFVSEMAEKSVLRRELDIGLHLNQTDISEKKFQSQSPTIININHQKVIDFAKNSLMTSGLSVTALNHYLECPNNFLYQSILKLPQAPAVSAEKGSAMHLALSRIWKSSNRSRKHIEKVMTKAIDEFFKTSLLAKSEKEMVREELLDIIPQISCSLKNHFEIGQGLERKNKVYAESWIQYDWITNIGGQKITVPIHGRLDAIIDNGKQVLVYDYKTRGKMSAAEIKGQTKSSKLRANGGYFRQLVFYKLLLENDSRFKGREIIPALMFLTPDKKGQCATISLPIQKDDIDAIKNTIDEIIKAVWSGKIIEQKCDDTKCHWCGMKLFL